MSELSANRSTPLRVEDLRANNIAIAVNERSTKNDGIYDHSLGACIINVDALNEVAMKKVSHIAQLLGVEDELATFSCNSSWSDALDYLRTMGVSVNFD